MHIHLITPIITEGVRTLDDVSPLMSDELSITQSLIATGPASIECEFDEAMSVPGIVVEALKAERAGCDAIIIDCMGDPGMKVAREMVSIPVLGPAETSMHVAAMLGHRFSVVTVLDAVVPMLENLATVYGVGGKLASVRSIGIPVLGLSRLCRCDHRSPECQGLRPSGDRSHPRHGLHGHRNCPRGPHPQQADLCRAAAERIGRLSGYN